MKKDGDPVETQKILAKLPKSCDAMSAMMRHLLVGMRSTAPSSDMTGEASVTLLDMAKIIDKAVEDMEHEE